MKRMGKRTFQCRLAGCGLVFASGFQAAAHLRLAHAEVPRDVQIAEKQRAYYEANREEIAEKKRAYREANREEIAEKKRALQCWDVPDIALVTGQPAWLVKEWTNGGARDWPASVEKGLWRYDDVRAWCSSHDVACEHEQRVAS